MAISYSLLAFSLKAKSEKRIAKSEKRTANKESRMQDFRKLTVWQKIHSLTLEMYKATESFPKNELFGLISQIRRAAISISLNIAEGAGRKTKKDFANFTRNAIGSTLEVIACLKIAEQEKFEQDLRSFESQLGLSVTAGSFPAASSGILDWPLDSVRITQYFGNTDFSTKNPQIYNGRGHTGMDFAASSGTRILSARGGIVLGTGNTDATCPNASYGKWVFIKHDNGLSTLYAHLSSISVSGGQSIGAGELVGYSGNTGYSTGPHLHFGVYATSGSEIASFPSSSCRGKTYTMPVGDTKAYLNPLSYLPSR